MKSYKDKGEFVAILSELWERISGTGEIVEAVSPVKIMVRFRFTDFQTDFYVDITGDIPRFFWDPEDPPDFDVEMILSSEVNHAFWMEELNMPLALAGRKIIAKGSVQKALKLLPALKPAFALYPLVLADMGREDLLRKPEKRKKKRWKIPFIPSRKKGYYNLDALPRFPLDLAMIIQSEREIVPSKEVRKASERDLLAMMYLIRFFEEHLSEAFRKGDLPTEAIHLSIGQEAVAAGVCMNLRDTDYLNTSHRGHGHIIGKGADLNRIMAEIYGKATGLCGGKGGPMHVTDRRKGILGANGIVGAGYLLGLGAGLTIQRQNRDDLSVVFAGDGSVNQGMFHEAMNMIAVYRLPVLIVIENNLYGEFTSVEEHSAVTEMYRRSASYNIESWRFDGNDVKTVYGEIGKIIEKIRVDGRPRLVELMTYRWHGHMEGDGETYRSQEEKNYYAQRDPIARLRNEMIAAGTAEDDLDNVRIAAERKVAEAAVFARKADLPKISDLSTHVYASDDTGLFIGEISTIAEESGRTRQISVSQAINEAIAEEMERDEAVFLWGEDVSLGGYFNVTEGLIDRFGPRRIIDTPISENGIVGGAVGAAMTGLRPLVEILFADFLTCCMDPILNQACKLRYMTGGQVRVPLTIRTPVGSGMGMAAQHSQSMEKYFFGIPGLIVVAPFDSYACKGLLKAAIRSHNPVLFFEHKLLYANVGKVPAEEYVLPLGNARVVHEGSDITIVSHLLGVGASLDAAKILASEGISAEVVDLATLYPLDSKTILESVATTGRLVTVEEGSATGGIGAEIISRIVLAGYHHLKDAPIRIAAPECPIPYAKNLETVMLPSPEDIAKRIAHILR